MNRRTFLAGTGAVLFAAPLGAEGQAGKVPRIGVLWPYSPAIATPFGDAFRQGLGRLGYVEGRSITLEERWADGKFDRLASRQPTSSASRLTFS
jgi:putative ABC transport system substrate-binding protein